jgi:hypothetical protein
MQIRCKINYSHENSNDESQFSECNNKTNTLTAKESRKPQKQPTLEYQPHIIFKINNIILVHQLKFQYLRFKK